jgi:hypothetical protein
MSWNQENGEVYCIHSSWVIKLESEKILRYLHLLSRIYAAGTNGDWRRFNIEKGNECKGELAGSPSN